MPRRKIERAVELAASILCYAFLENFAVALAIAGEDREAPPIPHMGREARSTLLHRLATLDVGTLRENVPLPMPNRVGSRAEWIVISLNSTDATNDLFPPPPTATCTQFRLDSPESSEWIHFVTAGETQRILRDAPSHASHAPAPHHERTPAVVSVPNSSVGPQNNDRAQ